ncbi:PREDICTED: nose resistant to fluoxetine protein 6-like isoform X2 [Polistes dominula]|uniref:Nose resistant to fluoxetine protein 6-like isoform X2 n=1 Tax=Polistes dominula TaxID=743375 RepID=A0ABM1JAZ1_POLDO|nr:PREDICTED: nose resistant to fluoxetine protein 6-like isoform X2 [Polistes dominula]
MARPGFKLLAGLLFFLNYCTANQMRELKIHALPVYAMLSNAELLNSTQCGKELTEFRQAIDQQKLWSLKVIDASGEPRSGFIYGNNYWLGSRSQCEDAGNREPYELSPDVLRNNSKYRHVEEEFPPFKVKFFVANCRHNSTLKYHVVIPDEDLIILGMCLPASCSKDHLSTLLEILMRNRTLFKGELYSADFTLVEVRDLVDDHRWLLSGTFITMTAIIILTLLLMIIGTAYDLLIYQIQLKKYNKYIQDRDNLQARGDTQALNDNNIDHPEKLKYQSFLWNIFLAFSAYSNTKRIFNMKSENADIPVIHGLRFFAMIMIILIHCYYFSMDFVENRSIVLRRKEEFFGQMMYNGGMLAVDTFFSIGGFLVAYLLTPTLMIISGLVQIRAAWNGKASLFYITERSHENCQKYWWRNILYIHNLFSLQEMCMSWSWYLANDMQYFLIINFLLFLSSTYFKIAASLLGILFTSSIILTGYISYIYNFIPTMDKLLNLMDVIYYPPWIRIGPYIVGVMTAYIVVKLNNKLLWKRKTIILFSILASLCNLLVLFGLYLRRMSVLTAAIYVALSRTVWAIGIAWLLIACCTNNGGIVNSILSCKVWIPFSRLTYAAYLLNPIVISSMSFLSESSLHFNYSTFGVLYVGYIIIVYICSYMVSLMFELPYIYLMKEVMDYLNIKT